MILEKAQEAAAYIKAQVAIEPQIAIVLGSGLGKIAEEIVDAVVIDYQDVPHFSKTSAPGHQGQLVVGHLNGKAVLCMQGRFHFYEGYTMEEVTFPIRVMALLGIKTLMASNAAGGINKDFNVGDLMLISDHINYMGCNPLVGANEEAFGSRFPDMSYAYHRGLAQVARETAAELGIGLQEGVYIACTGPSYETPAEIKMFRIMGADAVGMSTVPEVIVANHCGMKVLAISCISNMAAGILDQPLTEEEVLETGQKVSAHFGQLIKTIVEKL